jgi:hypothetical protein
LLSSDFILGGQDHREGHDIEEHVLAAIGYIVGVVNTKIGKPRLLFGHSHVSEYRTGVVNG